MSDNIENLNQLQQIYSSLGAALKDWSKVLNTINAAKVQSNASVMLKNSNLSQLISAWQGNKQLQTMLNTIADKMAKITESNMSGFKNIHNIDWGTYSVISHINTDKLVTVLELSNPLNDYDYNVMARTLQSAFKRAMESHESVSEEKEIDSAAIVEEIRQEYSKEEKIAEADSETLSKTKEKKKITSDEVWKIIERIGIIIAIFAGLRTLMSASDTKVYNTTNETNNYYINEMNIDAEYLNMCQYRIINQNNVKPRLKPDCSSRVTDYLEEGQVVQIYDRYKKWVQISWTDENGDSCFGWIQNYKLTEFKNYRTKMR